MEIFGIISFGILAILTSALLGGFTFMKLYEWFVSYAFDVQPLNFVQSIGLVFFLGFLKGRGKEKVTETEWEEFVAEFFTHLLFFALALGIGYVITLFH